MKAKQSELALLRLVAEAGGSMATADDRLTPFEFDAEPDSIDNCLSFGWLRFGPIDAGGSAVHLTPEGRKQLEVQS